MNINLRKADAIKTAINTAIEALLRDRAERVSINLYDDFQAQISDGANKFSENEQAFESLTALLYSIRKQISALNQSAGVSDILADLAHLRALHEHYAELVQLGAVSSDAAIKGRIARELEAPQDRFGSGPQHVVTSVLSDGDVETYKALERKTARKIRDMQDQLLAVNVKTEITLSAEDTAVLEAAGIV